MSASVFGAEEVVLNLSKLAPRLVADLYQAADIATKAVADFAKLNHPYTDRTTNLTQSIQQGTIVILDSGVDATVEARQPYASFVEMGTSRSKPYPFLWPAVAAKQKLFFDLCAKAYKKASGAS